ncbi:RNA-binding S4 domain-containing protein [Candidatus Frankia alpina]|uniref:RNA-binding S4 domain-containing protein n=1 Tax=Candidatus Frankia alpina TaxID=2699483 RepID=UPI001F25D06A|nr:RNA-binding S4 domain-containing protein [Candidatus Frankia alpina]
MLEGMRDVSIQGDAIRLGQFLKLADVVDVGSDVKGLLMGGMVRVNGEVESRRGRQLVPGDEVVVPGDRLRVG